MNTDTHTTKTRIIIGIAEIAVSSDTLQTLATGSLGSCLGIAVYDPIVKAGGIAHILLPNSKTAPHAARTNPAVFVDTGMTALLNAVLSLNAQRHRLLLYFAGGAVIPGTHADFNIGGHNTDAVNGWLRQNGLRPQSQHTGGIESCSIQLRLNTGEVRVKIPGRESDIRLCRGSTIT
ncbi:MAG: chemotaxis protein CheD [Verrucomicrobia bacterium]|nr:chemotaxis protein CheD [Verrucomicrobiota bacterium]